MAKFLVIAEKPSVAQSLAKILSAYQREDGYLVGNSCIVSWCLGHLAEYAPPPEIYDEKYAKWQFEDLPIIPEVWKVQVSEDKKKQFEVLCSLMNREDVAYLVNGCDAGREGELIFKRVYDLAGCQKPVKRLWISSMEDEAIQKGFQTLKDGKEYAGLCNAAVCRAQADWLIGMNATRAYTTRYFKRLVVGRVQTPTLAMLTERKEKFEHFKKEAYYKVSLSDGKLTVTSENIQSEAEADELRKLCDGAEAMVTKVKKAQKRISPPKLYDLTSLQREANRYFGYTAQKTLDMLQELYEEKMVTYPRTDSQYVTEDMKETVETLADEMTDKTLDMLQELYEEKMVTYPRTDSQYVTEDMKETVETLADEMTDFLPFLKSEQSGGNAERVINNTKVSDHHAILLTKEAVEKGMGGLSDGKKNLMMLIGQQLVQATGEDYLYEQTEISVQCKEHEFATKGKLPVQMGFKEVEEAFRKYCVKDKKSDEPDNKTGLPEGYEEGMILISVKAEKSTHYTSPPKMFTEDTLLAAMETAGNKEFDSETEKKGLGTPATRANIIEKLVSSGYAERKGKQILPTAAGCELIHVMPENLKSASLTAEWENQLLMMEKGKIRDDEFMDGIVSMITEILSVCRAIPEEERSRFQTAREVIGKCPICGSDVYEGKSNYYCSDRSCPFALWKSNRFLESMKKSMDKKMAVELLKRGRTHVKGLYSKKKDSKFDADLVLGVEDGKARFSLEFPKKKTNSNKQK